MLFRPSQYSEQSYGQAALMNASRVPVPGVTGVFMAPGIDIRAEHKEFAKALRRALGFDFTITSGYRGPARQASAMYTKFAQGGAQELFDTYKSDHLVQELLDEGPSVEAFQRALERQAARGTFISRHMQTDAIDVRVSDLTQDQQKKLMDTARELGAHVLYEGTPPHIHIGKFAGGIWTTLQTYGPLVATGITVAFAGIGLLTIGGLYYTRARWQPYLPHSVARRLTRR